MSNIDKYTELLLNEINRHNLSNRVAVIAGKFRPPHKGHFSLVQQVADLGFSTIKIVISTGGELDGISEQDTKYVWQIYAKYVNADIEVIDPFDISPVQYVYANYLNKVDSKYYYLVVGNNSSTDKEKWENAEEKYDHKCKILHVDSKYPNIHGTSIRKQLNSIKDPDAADKIVQKFLPEELDTDDKKIVTALLVGSTHIINKIPGGTGDGYTPESVADYHEVENDVIYSELVKGIRVELEHFDNEIRAYEVALDHLVEDPRYYTKTEKKLGDEEHMPADNTDQPQVKEEFDRKQYYKTHIENIIPFKLQETFTGLIVQMDTTQLENILDIYINSLTEYILSRQEKQYDPPTYELVGTPEATQEILSPTAYYNPNDYHIVVFTANRHPKDVLRSYAHELIHHIQNSDGRIHNVQTTNIHEDNTLYELEMEAYLMGNIFFREWENQIKNNRNA